MLPERQYVEESWYAEEEQVRFKVYTNNKTKHKKRHLRKLSPKSKIVLCMVFIFTFCLMYVSLEATITQVGYVVNQLQADIAVAQDVNDRMMLEVEELASPERIAQYAIQNEGMVFAAEGDVIYSDIDIKSKVAEDVNVAPPVDPAVAGTVTEELTSNSIAAKDENVLVSAFASVVDKFADGRNSAAAIAQ